MNHVSLLLSIACCIALTPPAHAAPVSYPPVGGLLITGVLLRDDNVDGPGNRGFYIKLAQPVPIAPCTAPGGVTQYVKVPKKIGGGASTTDNPMYREMYDSALFAFGHGARVVVWVEGCVAGTGGPTFPQVVGLDVYQP